MQVNNDRYRKGLKLLITDLALNDSAKVAAIEMATDKSSPPGYLPINSLWSSMHTSNYKDTFNIS